MGASTAALMASQRTSRRVGVMRSNSVVKERTMVTKRAGNNNE